MTKANPHASTPSGLRRARAFAIPFEGTAGPLNAITDVAGVTVGYTTLIEGDDVRTGVTAILPLPKDELSTPLFAGFHSFNGNGEMSGVHLIEETGRFNFPITITNTHSCGMARDATLKWVHQINHAWLDDTFGLPVAAETSDAVLNDMNGHHVTDAHVFAALDGAKAGSIDEGSVGGGTGMRAFGFKAGSGTASRLVDSDQQTYTIGVFVQANFGLRPELTVRGRRAGLDLVDFGNEPPAKSSIIGVLASDAPFLPHQLKRLARRMPLGVGLTGGIGHHGSGDLFLAFSTANSMAASSEGSVARMDFIPDQDINPFFAATVQATEEAILNALIANRDMSGRGGSFTPALPHDWLERTFGLR